ncbi:MAG: hypothetical protein Q4F03_00055 [Eubacteriales bacterium]|nr:hypothetical protein [Eubacteriales bacterium]
MENIGNKYLLIESNEANRMLLQKEDKCDKYDYITAVVCGTIGGMIDIFLVGAPGESILGNWTDQQVDKTVMAFARKMGWNPKEKSINNVNSAIGFLERNAKVNYDQRKTGDVGDLFTIAPNTHHMMSLAHSPDIVGLFFSILNQFTSTSSFIANGQLVTIATDTYELQGGNFVMKIMCGIANWFCHLMSDVAGSSGKHSRGTGIVMPFYELFGLCKFGSFSAKGNERKDLAEIAQMAFTRGYDFRFGLTQAIPLVVTELSIRLIWAIRRRFQYHKPIKECIPTMKHTDLRVMLLLGNGTLCIMDGIDAGIRSGGNFLDFFMRMNMCAWFRLVTLVLKEVYIRVGFSNSIQRQIDSYKRTTEALHTCLEELKRIDLELYERETREYNNVVRMFESVTSEKELTVILLESYEKLGIKKPWVGEFDEHMSNKNGKLVFE